MDWDWVRSRTNLGMSASSIDMERIIDKLGRVTRGIFTEETTIQSYQLTSYTMEISKMLNEENADAFIEILKNRTVNLFQISPSNCYDHCRQLGL